MVRHMYTAAGTQVITNHIGKSAAREGFNINKKKKKNPIRCYKYSWQRNVKYEMIRQFTERSTALHCHSCALLECISYSATRDDAERKPRISSELAFFSSV